MSKKRPVPFIRQVKDAENALADVFGNINVRRCATRDALLGIKVQVESYIAALDEDEANDVQDESIKP